MDAGALGMKPWDKRTMTYDDGRSNLGLEGVLSRSSSTKMTCHHSTFNIRSRRAFCTSPLPSLASFEVRSDLCRKLIPLERDV
jgi:hypothetical protein